MTGMNLEIDSLRLERAMARAPVTLAREMESAIGRIVQTMARAARRKAPKAHSHLVNAIGAVHASPFEGLVAAGVDYARLVEEGTGPARAGVAGSPTLFDHILDWVKVKRLVPDDPAMDQRDLAFVIARAIALRGTPAQPFMGPAFDQHKAEAERRIEAAIDRALGA